MSSPRPVGVVFYLAYLLTLSNARDGRLKKTKMAPEGQPRASAAHAGTRGLECRFTLSLVQEHANEGPLKPHE